MHTVLASPVAGHCREIGSGTFVADRYPGLLECFRVIAVTGGPASESPCSFVIRITCRCGN